MTAIPASVEGLPAVPARLDLVTRVMISVGNAAAAAVERKGGSRHAEAGVDVRRGPCRGHIHASLTAVDMIISGAPIPAQTSDAISSFFVSAGDNWHQLLTFAHDIREGTR